nr:DUF4870 domain-containing protein [Geomicrobium sp. JCM 19037]
MCGCARKSRRQFSDFLFHLCDRLIYSHIRIYWLRARIYRRHCWIVFVIIATVKASNGELYKYPLSIPFIR